MEIDSLSWDINIKENDVGTCLMKYQQDIGEWNESEWEGQGQYAIPIPSITKEDKEQI